MKITDEMVEMAARAIAKINDYGDDDLDTTTDPDKYIPVWSIYDDDAIAAIEAVAPLIAAAEREKCAKVAENNSEPNYADDDESLYSQGYDFAAIDIARAIRARGDD